MALGLDAIVEGDGSPQEEEGDGEAKHGQRWRLFGMVVRTVETWRRWSQLIEIRNPEMENERDEEGRKEEEEGERTIERWIA